MKVRELINHLTRYDPDIDVLVYKGEKIMQVHPDRIELVSLQQPTSSVKYKVTTTCVLISGY